MTTGVHAEPRRTRIPRERVELILSRLEELPTLPAIAVKLLNATTSDDSCARDVVGIVEADASLTAAVLRMASRADLGVDSRVMTVQRAVTLLGFKAVRNVVLSIKVYDALNPSNDQERKLDVRRELWKHGLAVACAADMLAESANGTLGGGEAFVCGLLHDIGKIALDTCLPKSYARVIACVERKRSCICDAERDLFGIDHTVAGKHLAKCWGLPREIVECIWLHHQDLDSMPSSLVNPQLVGLIHLADNVVRRQRVGFSGYQHIDDVETLADRLGVNKAGLSRAINELPSRVAAFSTMVGLDDSTGQTLYAESLAKLNKELSLVNDELAETNRRLELRAACFQAQRTLTNNLTDQSRPADVCAAAARSALKAFDTQHALAFIGDSASLCLHFGHADGSRASSDASIIELDEEHNRDLLGPALAVQLERKIVAAPDGCELLWHRCTGSPPPAALYMLPFIETDTLIGAVLFTADADTTFQWQGADEECHALASAIELAVLSSKAAIDAEHMNDELLSANRRLRDVQNELVRTRSVTMIAKMAAGAAHELNNPLSVISGRAQMAEDETDDENTARALALIREKSHEASQIVTDLMEYAKPDTPKPVPLVLATVLESLCQYWRKEFSLRADQLKVALAESKSSVFADPEQLGVILKAVVRNSVEVGDPETLRVQVNSPSRLSDETVRIVVEDNGPGMAPETLEHAIDPFFSSRTAGRGRGLGLSRAHRLVEINGGRLWIESTTDVGTRVTIELPARAHSAESPAN